MKRSFVVFFVLATMGIISCQTAPLVVEDVPRPVVTAPEPVKQIIINGSIGNEISEKELIISVQSNYLEEAVQEGTDLAWTIENLPAGLTAEAKRAEKGATTITIVIGGTPGETKQEPVVLSEEISGTLGGEYRFDIAAAAAQLALHIETAGEPWRHNANTQSISGILGKTIISKDVQITLTEAALKEAIVKDKAVDWITNLPTGLSAIVRKAEAHATALTITVSGTPTVAKDEPVLITIPKELVDRDIDLKVAPSEDVRYEISNLQVGFVRIGGAQGREISPKDVVLSLQGTSVKTAITNGASLGWIHNLPAGLTASAKAAAVGDKTVTITVTGTPKETKQEPLSISIPDSALTNGLELVWEPNIEVLFDIGTQETYDYGAISTNSTTPNWRGNANSQANFPTIPAIKDFEGIGIVSLTTQVVEALGPDNQYHWTGEYVTYSKLMAEARKIGAHGIINITIDSEDKVNHTKTTVYLEAGHTYTAEERAKIRAGLLKEVTVDGVKYLEETSRVTTRTYTGTALAIKYTGGINFFEVEQLKTEAQKAEAEAARAEAITAKAVAEAAKAQAETERARVDAIRAEAEAQTARNQAQQIQAFTAQPAESPAPRK